MKKTTMKTSERWSAKLWTKQHSCLSWALTWTGEQVSAQVRILVIFLVTYFHHLCTEIFDCGYIIYHLQCTSLWTRAGYVINFASLHDNDNPWIHSTIAYWLTTRRHKQLSLLKTRGSLTTSRKDTGPHPRHYNIVLHGENVSFSHTVTFILTSWRNRGTINVVLLEQRN